MIENPPNILWYCADQMRYDTIAALGNSEIRTPNLDRLTKSGMAFTRAYAQCQVCTPSRASFLTGRYPASTRVYRNGTAAFPPGEVLVTKLLADAGYDCGLIGKLHLSSATAGETRIDDGYRFFQWSHNPMTGEADEQNAYHHWLRQKKNADPDELFESQLGFVAPGVPEELHQTTWCTEMALHFLDEKRDQPWLLSINPYDPHPPFDPPEEYLNHYDPEQLTPPLFRESDLVRQEQFKTVRAQTVNAVDPSGSSSSSVDYESQSARGYRPPESYDGREAKAAYYAMIELIDHQFGRILDRLEATGELEKTVIVFMSDHGELLGDHGLMYKGCRFFEGLVHVPLIISTPKMVTSSTVSNALVELVDVAPTLLELAGSVIPDRMQGQSLAPILRGDADIHFHKSTVFCDFNDSVGYSPIPDYTQATMTFDGRYKLALYHSHDIGELFDLDSDPGEFENLFDDPEYAELRDRLILRHLNRFAGTLDAGIERISNA